MIRYPIILTFIYQLISHVICGPMPSRTTAVFYNSMGSKDGKISYRDDPRGFSDLKKLFSSSNLSPKVVCVSGAWLLYDKHDYNARKDDEVKLISGNDYCIEPPDISNIVSMQPVTPSTFSPEGSITLFPRVNFGGDAFRVSDAEGRRDGLKLLEGKLTTIGSLVVFGETPWSLLSSSGKIMCVRPKPDQDSAICYGKDLLSVQIADFHIDAVAPDCPDEHDESIVANVRLSDCKNFASGEIEVLTTKGAAMMGRSLGEEGGGGSEGIVAIECPPPKETDTSNNTKALSAEESELLTKMLKLRLTHDFDQPMQILWPDRDQDLWKTEPLDFIYDIVMATVPETIVSLPFLRRVREFTIYHLNEIWKAEGETESTDPNAKLFAWKNHRVIGYMLSKCLELASSNSIRYQMLTTSAYNMVSTIEEFKQRIRPEFQLNMDYDPVLETTYVVINYAMAICHNAFQYNLNFWDAYVTTVYSMYFMPLQDRWKNPVQLSPASTRAIFAGFGVTAQHMRLAFATSMVFETTPNMKAIEKFYEE